MDATNSPRDRKRAERWVDQSSGIGYVPPEAFLLLTRRLAARRRVLVSCTPFLVIVVGILALSLLDSPALGSENWAFADWMLAAYGVLSVGHLFLNRLNARAEAQIGESLPHRVSRGTAVSVPMMLGRVRTMSLIVTLMLEAAFAVTLLWLRSGWLAWGFLLAFAVACGFAAVGVKQAATRATIAVDPVSLAIDERLRSQDAFSATDPLYLLLFAFSAVSNSARGSGSLDLIWLALFTILSGLRFWALIRAPWGRVPFGRAPSMRPQPGGESP